MSLETQIAGAVTEARKVFDLVTGQFGKWDGQVKAQIKKLEDWKYNVIQNKVMTVEKDNYRTIAKFSSWGLTSSFRLVIGGTYGNFVFGGVYEIVCTHPTRLDIVEVVSSHYGKITLKISVDNRGSGHVEIRTDSGSDGVHSLQISLIPYIGSVVHTSESVDYTDKSVHEMSYE